MNLEQLEAQADSRRKTACVLMEFAFCRQGKIFQMDGTKASVKVLEKKIAHRAKKLFWLFCFKK